MKKYRSLLYILVIAFASCENEIPYNLTTPNPKLIMNALINADSPENILHLQYTGKTTPGRVEDAIVEVFINGVLNEEPSSMEEKNDNIKRFKIKSRFKPGDVVRIDARTSDGKHHAWIEETVPSPPNILGIDTSAVVGYPQEYLRAEKRLRVKVTLKDHPKQKNYYRIVHEKTIYMKGITESGKDTTIIFKDFDYWPWEDIVLTDGHPISSDELDSSVFIEHIKNIYGTFSDSRFADSQYTMNTWFSLYNPYYHPDLIMHTHISADVAIRVLSITEAEYCYCNVLNFIDSDAYDEFLNDPPKIPSNVHGGTGFVGISTESGKVFQLMDKDVSYDY